ncbi:MAG: UDP-N-acetylmuramate--L-alanine ligase [Ferruginibacter sp.]
MNDFNNISSVYFLGIGGIGMSALARYFNSRGIKVSGYDKTETVLTKQLVAEGIHIHYEDDISLIDKQAKLIVYTPAVPNDHKEYNYFLQNDYSVLKRSEVLGMITKNSYSICVAGTHGKTTTSSMIAHILRHSEFGCNAFLGGIASNYNTNFWASDKNVSVAEADEYDRSFLKLSPDVAIVTSMDADHLDIYGTAENLQDAFIEFTSKIKEGGLLISKYGLIRSDEFKVPNMIRYSLHDSKADAVAENIKINNGSYQFDVRIKEEIIKDVFLNMGGMHNIENAIAAITVAKHVGITDEKIKDAVAKFKGVKRRFEYIIKEDGLVMIDDYAHHPEELRALINGAKELFPGKKCTVVFQPHLFSRTKDFADGFGEVLSIPDEVLLLPIYPARELPMEGVTSEMVIERMKMKKVKVLSKEALLDEMRKNKPELLIISGAGDIDTLVEPIKEILINK